MEPLRKDGCESFLDNYNILSLEAPVAIVLSHEAEFYVFSPSVDVLLCQWQVAFNEISLDMRYYHENVWVMTAMSASTPQSAS